MTDLKMDATRLQSFLSKARSRECIEFAALRTGADHHRVAFLLDTYAAEVPVVLSLLEGTSLSGRRLLDVGAGIGLTSFFLYGEGYNVTALEPGGIGFDLNQPLFIALREYFNAGQVPLLSIGAEALTQHAHGNFDVMFSANVLEHVSDLESVVEAMARILSNDGVMIHTCPNYAFPYEPHYGLFLLPFVPARTPWAGNRKTQDVWMGLNFITVRQLDRLARTAGLEPHFERGTMARAVQRLLQDPIFASRHPGLTAIARFMRASGVLYLLKNLTARFATPLVMRALKRSSIR